MDENPHLQAAFSQNQHIIKNKAFWWFVVIFLLFKLFSSLLPNQHYTLASDLTPDNILNAVNSQRSLNDLPTLNTNPDLAEAAQSKSDDMIARKYFAHVDPDGHYIWDKIVADGYTPYTMLGENLAIEFYDTDSLMAAWMNSPEHRANILQAGFKDQGMGLSFGDVQEGQYYSAVTNTFGALAITVKTQAPKTPPASSPAILSPTPAKTKVAPSAAPTPAPKPVALASSTTTTAETLAQTLPNPAQGPSNTIASEPLETRGQTPASKASQSALGFALAPQEQPTASFIQSPSAASINQPENLSQPASTVIGNDGATVLSNYEINRYLILICGVALMLFLLSDIKIALEKRFHSLDKKFNNLGILIISLIVIAFMYWL